MISLSANTPTTISDLSYTFPVGLTSLVSPGDLFTVEDIQGSNDLESALTAGTVNVIDGFNVKLTTIKNVGLGDVSSGCAMAKEGVFTTFSATTIVVDGKVAEVTDNYVTGATLNSTTLELERTGGLSDVTVDLSSISGGGTDKFVSGATYSEPTTAEPKIAFVGNSSETTFNVLTNVFGTYYHYAEDLSESGQLADGSFTTYLTLSVTSTIPDGIYRVGWSFEFYAEQKDSDVMFRVRVDDDNSKVLLDIDHEVAERKRWYSVGGFGNVTFGSNGTHTIDFDIATENTADYILVRNVRLEFWRVDSVSG